MSLVPDVRARLLERMVAAALLDTRVFSEVSQDRAANGQAFLVVVLTGVFNGLGLVRRLGTRALSVGVGAALLGWFLWVAIVFIVAHALRQRSNGRSLLRALAYANAPGLFLVFGVVPVLGDLIRPVVVLWLLAATAVAAQAVYQVSRRRGAVIALIAFVLYLLVGVWVSYVIE
jgi:hypothetical protein